MKARHEFPSDEDYHKYLKTYFAAMAMIGLLFRKDDLHPVAMVAEKAVKQADALLHQLNKEQ